MKSMDVAKLVASEINRIEQSELVRAIGPFLIEPRVELREWDYGNPDDRFPCWTVIEHPPSNTAIAYCEHGFGPKYPWGLLFIEGPHLSMGMDAGWFASLEDAVRNSFIWDGENPEGYEVE